MVLAGLPESILLDNNYSTKLRGLHIHLRYCMADITETLIFIHMSRPDWWWVYLLMHQKFETGKPNSTLKYSDKFLKVFLLVLMYHHYTWATDINWQKLMQTQFPYSLILKLSSNKALQYPRVLYSTGHVFMLQNLRTSLKWWNCYSLRIKYINHYYSCFLNWR